MGHPEAITPEIYATVDQNLPADRAFAVFDDETCQRVTVKSGRALRDDELRDVVAEYFAYLQAKGLRR